MNGDARARAGSRRVDAPKSRGYAWPRFCDCSMEPIGICVRSDGEWALVHRCSGCATVHVNRIAGDDNPLTLMHLAVRPLAQPPFPLEWLTRI